MNRRSVAGVVGLVLVGMGGLMLWWWRRPPAPPLYPGYVEVQERILTFPFPGKVVDVRVREGDRVVGGEVLMVEDTTELHYQQQALLAKLAASRQREKALNIRLRKMQNTLERMQPLAGTGVSREEMDRLQSERRALKAELGALQATRHALEAQLEALRYRLREAVLRAPRGGMVLDIMVYPGERAWPGQPALRLGLIDTVTVVAFVPEPDLPTVHRGDTLWVRMDDQPGQWSPAVVSWISPTAEYAAQYVQTPENRVDLVFRIHLTLPNPEGRFHAGIPVDVARRSAF